MGSDSSIPITAGSGTPVDTWLLADGNHQQVVREARATAESDVAWAAATTAGTSVVAADASRVNVLITNNSTGRVYLRFDATAPTAATNGHHWYLESGDRWEMPVPLSTLAISAIATVASGHVVFSLATAA